MKNQHSHQDKVKALAMAKEKTNLSIASFYARLVIDEAILNEKIRVIRDEIDDCLEKGDRERFMSLSLIYRDLMR